MLRPSPFHVRIVQPAHVRELLTVLLRSEGSAENETALQEQCPFRVCEPLLACRTLGLVEGQALALTSQGIGAAQVADLKPSLFADLVHFCYCSTWDERQRQANRFSWSYSTLSGLLWDSGCTQVNRKQLATAVVDEAMRRFDTTLVSFSENSVTGVLTWLSALHPPVITQVNAGSRRQAVFTRRTFCPPEILLMAADYLYRIEGADYQTNLLLDAKKQETICKLCLLEPASFDAALEWTAGQYPFLQRGGSGGWGSYILVTRRPQLRDFLG